MSATLAPPAAPGGPSGASLGALGLLPPPVVDGDARLAQEDEAAQPNMELADQLKAWIEAVNIADDLDDGLRQEIANETIREYNLDEQSRAEWLQKHQQWLDFAMQITQAKTYPWPDACYSLDTDILTQSGWRSIAEVKVGDLVLSRAPDRSASFQRVTQTFRHTAPKMVHFEGKSIDLLVTPNHRMVVESKYGKRKKQHFIEAERFLSERLAWRYIPLTSEWTGKNIDTIHGIDARAYLRFLGWYISEGSNFTPLAKPSASTLVEFGERTTSSFAIAQSEDVNAEKHAQIKRDLRACGFTFSANPKGFVVHARSMPDSVKEELRSLGLSDDKHIPAWAMELSSKLLRELLDTLMMGDGHARLRKGKKEEAWVYSTTSALLAGQVQTLCQQIGWRGTISERAAQMGGVINGRAISGALTIYHVSINRKDRIQVAKMERRLVPGPCEVACVEVEPHHTVYVRRNGKALWCGNSNVVYPLLTTAAIQFAARAYPAVIRDKDVVKGTIVGSDKGVPQIDQQTGQPAVQPGPPGQDGQPTPMPVWQVSPGIKKQRADKIGQHMSWQLLEEQEEWEPQTDRLLIVLPIVGCVFRKSYFDPGLQRNVSAFVSAADLCVNYKAKSFETAPRQSEILRLYPYEIEEKIRAGIFLEEDYGTDVDSGPDDDALCTFIEQHRRWDLDDDGYSEPYIVTVARDSGKLARIKAAYDMDGVFFSSKDHRIRKIDRVGYYTKYGFIPSPDSGVYDIGFGHLLWPINDAINSTLNQMFDAGHLANVGGGFIGSTLSMNAGSIRFQVGEYKPVNVSGGNIRDAVFPMPFPGPNPVLYQLLVFLVEAGKEIASVKDVMVGDLPGDNTSGVATLAMIEQGLKVFSAIYKRIHRSLKQEFKKLFRLNRLYLPMQSGYRMGDEWHEISQQDYQEGAGVEPVSDPQMVTDMQKLGRAQFLMQFKDDPWFKGRELRLKMLDAALFPDAENLLNDQMPPDPNVVTQAASMEVEHKALDLRMLELKIRGAHEEANTDIKRAEAVAGGVLKLAQAIKALAEAEKADHDVNQGWYATHLDALKLEMDRISVAAEANAPDSSPSAAAGNTAGTGAVGGTVGSPIPTLAPPPGVTHGPPLSQ